MKMYESKGMICLKGDYNIIYKVCDITYIIREDETFEYTFVPNYSVISLLSSKYFQGIPGLNLDLKKEKYIRKNIVPTFISERVPQPSREDYYELLEKVNLEYMDPILYLIRTKEQYFGDNFFVLPYEEKLKISFDTYANNDTNASFIKEMLRQICLGNDIIFNCQLINNDNRKSFHDVLIGLYTRAYIANKDKQIQGINKAKELGHYQGRKPIHVDELKFIKILDKAQKNELTAKEAAKELNISIDKYYRVKKRLQKENNISIISFKNN